MKFEKLCHVVSRWLAVTVVINVLFSVSTCVFLPCSQNQSWSGRSAVTNAFLFHFQTRYVWKRRRCRYVAVSVLINFFLAKESLMFGMHYLAMLLISHHFLDFVAQF